MKYITFTDGGARGNPGPAAIGGVVYDEHQKKCAEISRYIGETTNNQAEYQALLATLTEVQKLGGREVDCYLDSELVVRQMNRIYKVKDPGLAAIFVQIHNLVVQIGTVRFHHVRREQNKEADALVNKALDAL